MSKLLPAFAIILIVSVSNCYAQMSFNFGSTGNEFADRALVRATDRWASEFQDDITVNLNFEFSFLNADILAGTDAKLQLLDFSSFRAAIGADITSDDDTTMFNSLPVGTSFSHYITRTQESGGANFEVPYVDNNGGANNLVVNIASANAKALGLINGDATSLDATIVFNNTYSWDFDPDDGITGSALDFLGIATHEIGHALGFISGVDVLGSGSTGGAGGGGDPAPDDFYTNVTSLDFLRHSDDSVDAGADFDWTADTRDKYFSIDGGNSAAIAGGSHWSTSVLYGDGEQASHWKDGLGLGIMDPTAEEGMVYDISANDRLAFDVIGYDLFNGGGAVPEPGAFGIAWLALIPILKRRRKSLS